MVLPYHGGLWFGRVHPTTHSIKRPHFPAAGYRNNSSGTSINNVGSYGNCWSSSANSDANARNLNLNGTNFNWNNNNRANGFSVRPVAEAFADRRTLPFCFAKFQGKTASSSQILSSFASCTPEYCAALISDIINKQG